MGSGGNNEFFSLKRLLTYLNGVSAQKARCAGDNLYPLTHEMFWGFMLVYVGNGFAHIIAHLAHIGLRQIAVGRDTILGGSADGVGHLGYL